MILLISEIVTFLWSFQEKNMFFTKCKLLTVGLPSLREILLVKSVFLKQNFKQITNSESKFSKSQISFLMLYHLKIEVDKIPSVYEKPASNISCHVQHIEVWVKLSTYSHILTCSFLFATPLSKWDSVCKGTCQKWGSKLQTVFADLGSNVGK